MAQDLSHLQCTDVRRFRNSPTESHARFLHSFRTPERSVSDALCVAAAVYRVQA